MMRLATWNIEWFDALFDAQSNLLADRKLSRRYKTTRETQADAIAYVLERLDADLVMIIEAPNDGPTQSTVKALEGFAAAYSLRQTKAVVGFTSHTHQEIAALYDPSALSVRHAPQETPFAPQFDTRFPLDIDVDDQPDTHVWSKPPLELAIKPPKGPEWRLIGVHAKSKAPRNAGSEEEENRISIANRRKQLAQCIWLRRRIDDMLQQDQDVLVMGDLNDGPGLDHYEKLFGRSSVEVVMGAEDEVQLFDPHASAARHPRQGFFMGTARFYHKDFRRYVNALLDYIMVSPRLRARHNPRWRIWHPFDDPRLFADPPLRDALLAASDHFPVSIDLDHSVSR